MQQQPDNVTAYYNTGAVLNTKQEFERSVEKSARSVKFYGRAVMKAGMSNPFSHLTPEKLIRVTELAARVNVASAAMDTAKAEMEAARLAYFMAMRVSADFRRHFPEDYVWVFPTDEELGLYP